MPTTLPNLTIQTTIQFAVIIKNVDLRNNNKSKTYEYKFLFNYAS